MKGYSEVPMGCTNKCEIRKSVPGDPKLYVLHEINSACVFIPLSCAFFFVGDKIVADCFNDSITLSL